MIAFIMICCLAAIAYLSRAWMSDTVKREERMANRIDKLEDFQRNELLSMVGKCQIALDDNSAAMRELTVTLRGRPCLLTAEKQKTA